MPTAVSLSQLVDLAVGSPEVGAVNFNVLHTLLHAMINKLNIQDVKADIDEHDRELLSTHPGARAFSAFSVYSADSGKGEDSFSVSDDSLSDKSIYVPSKRSPYHVLEKRVSDLVKQLEELNKLPSNEQLVSRTLGKETERPVSDMWQYMQLKKRVDASEEGIGKLMSLVEDLMKDMKDLKDSQKDLLNKVNEINIDDVNKRLDAMDDLYKELNDKYDGLNSRLSNVPSFDDLNQYLSTFVTWPGLEDALKGVRQDFENLQQIKEERVVIEHGIQTEPPELRSRPPSASAKPASRSSSARSRTSNSGGPSSELLDLLERLGKLSDDHEKLKKRVDELEKLLELKANKEDLEGLGISDDLRTLLKNLQDEIGDIKGQIRDEANLRRLQDALQKLLVDVDRLQKSMEFMATENSDRVKEIQELQQYCDSLNERKADKEYVDMEVDVKADRRQLEGKVNHTLFDSTTSEMNRMIKDILDKLNGQDGDWKSALAKAMEELDGKLDRREMNNLKGWLEKQLKALNNKIKTMGPGWQLDDEAAGMKKQLIQRFNCLSCDKPINVMPHPPVPSIPSTYGLPKYKSPRPYVTFELDHIRQMARSPAMNPESTDYYATLRQCGGNHTLTHPHKRATRLSNAGQLLQEEETIVPLYKEEIDVLGADGQIYKGRINSSRLDAKIPGSLTSYQAQPIYVERAQSPMQFNRPLSAKGGRPSSRQGSAQSHRRFRSESPQVRIMQDSMATERSQAEESRAITPHPEDSDFVGEHEDEMKEKDDKNEDTERVPVDV